MKSAYSAPSRIISIALVLLLLATLTGSIAISYVPDEVLLSASAIKKTGLLVFALYLPVILYLFYHIRRSTRSSAGSFNVTDNSGFAEIADFHEKIADNAPGIITVSSQITKKYLYVNEASEQLLGYSKEEIIEKGQEFVRSLIHPDDLQ